MGLTGLEIYKQLPKKNCGECGPPTCLAFAMALAAGKANLESCPYVSDAAKEALSSAAAPPIKLVKIGPDSRLLEVGDETVLFRHEKTFYHPTGLAVQVSDSLPADEFVQTVKRISELTLERVGQTYKLDLVALKAESGDPDVFGDAARKIAETSDIGVVLISEDPVTMEKGLSALEGKRPLIYCATEANYEKMTELAKKYNAPLAVKGNSLDDLADLVDKVVALGHKELVLDPGSRQLSRLLADLTQIRRLAIKKRFRSLGYPTIAFTTAEEPEDEVLEAVFMVGKYASIVVLKAQANHHLLPLCTWRFDIYTDPQKPIQVQPKVYEIGDVTDKSPVYVTTNFSLTYYSVQGEVEASKIPAYIIACDTEGKSVLTSWADGKFTAEVIAETIKKTGIEQKVSHREIVIPGGVAVLSGKLRELSGWNVIVGPREAAGIPSFARARYA